jgi:hypothetical protein
MAAAFLSSFTFAPLKTGKLKFRDSGPRRPARDLTGVPPFAPGWGWEAGDETARETENLATWGGESGRGRRAATEIPGVGGVGRQNFRFSVFQ